MIEYIEMEKVIQRNWLLIITVFLLIASISAIVVTARKKFGVGVCVYNGMQYLDREFVPGYNGREDCFCTWGGEIVCEDPEYNMSYESFSSRDLFFSYSFKNFLEKEDPDYSKITLSDINHVDNHLEIQLEREVFCSTSGAAPTQVGMYEVKSNSLVLTTITNRDKDLYDRTCLIGNVFSFEGFNLSDKDEYSLFYQNERGQLFDLNACFYNGTLYGLGDVFNDSLRNKICTCEGVEVDCEDLK